METREWTEVLHLFDLLVSCAGRFVCFSSVNNPPDSTLSVAELVNASNSLLHCFAGLFLHQTILLYVIAYISFPCFVMLFDKSPFAGFAKWHAGLFGCTCPIHSELFIFPVFSVFLPILLTDLMYVTSKVNSKHVLGEIEKNKNNVMVIICKFWHDLLTLVGFVTYIAAILFAFTNQILGLLLRSRTVCLMHIIFPT